jgi:hypothetical protein
MEAGFLLDRGYTTFPQMATSQPVEWIAGNPEFSWMGNVKYKASVPTETWCCMSCGYLESYAAQKRDT